jgi:hypothetical protein
MWKLRMHGVKPPLFHKDDVNMDKVGERKVHTDVIL